jgi:transketolase
LGSTSANLSAAIRRTVLDQSKRANVGHIGSALSIADILGVLYAGTLRGGDGDPDRDRFILSKGHAVLALYAALHASGRMDADQLDRYCGDGSPLAGHPEHKVPGIDFSTGSLGQGLTFGGGAALAARLQGAKRRVFVLVSDAELNEGSVWECVMFAAHHRLANLVAIVDLNGQQALGYTRDVIDLSPVADRWAAFGWDVHEVDGHDVGELERTIASLDTDDGAPHVLLARTIFGRGVSYMERQISWHYWPMSDEQYAQALDELDAD